MTSTEQVIEFEALRPQLLAVAYRLTGTVASYGRRPTGGKDMWANGYQNR